MGRPVPVSIAAFKRISAGVEWLDVARPPNVGGMVQSVCT